MKWLRRRHKPAKGRALLVESAGREPIQNQLFNPCSSVTVFCRLLLRCPQTVCRPAADLLNGISRNQKSFISNYIKVRLGKNKAPLCPKPNRKNGKKSELTIVFIIFVPDVPSSIVFFSCDVWECGYFFELEYLLTYFSFNRKLRIYQA